MANNKIPIKNNNKAFFILALLSKDQYNLSEIAREVKLPTTTIQNVAQKLLIEGYLKDITTPHETFYKVIYEKLETEYSDHKNQIMYGLQKIGTYSNLIEAIKNTPNFSANTIYLKLKLSYDIKKNNVDLISNLNEFYNYLLLNQTNINPNV